MKLPHIKNTYYITYGVFYLLGILTFIPNYFVLTASPYWLFKFRFIGRRPNPDDTNAGPPKDRNVLQAIFPTSYYIVAQLTLIIFLTLTAAYSKKLPPPDKRISAALLCTLVFYVVNLAFCRIITDSFQVVFFFIVLCIACFLGVCSAVILVSLFEMVRDFPAEYYNAILTGQALCGVISAIIQIVSISVTQSPVEGGLIFFGIGTILVLITIAIYWYSKRDSQYFIYSIRNEATAEVTFEHRKFLPRVFAKIVSCSNKTKYCVSSLLLVLGSTAIVYPGFMSLVVAEDSTGKIGESWDEEYFVPVVTFLLASFCDLAGRIVGSKLKWPSNQWVILTIGLLRLAFIPLIVLCNAQPRMRLPVAFYDVPYIVFTVLLSFSNGYLINLCVALIPTTVQSEEEKSSVYVMVVISSVLCVAGSSFLSLFLIYLI